ncbi:MAG TPA: hypothetical protein VFQ06_09120 [Nitrospira sp.]|nr:hypothetical protein [Nitrospira sp.]
MGTNIRAEAPTVTVNGTVDVVHLVVTGAAVDAFTSDSLPAGQRFLTRDGQPMALVVIDAWTDPESVAEMFQELFESEKFQALFSHSLVSTVLPVAGV